MAAPKKRRRSITDDIPGGIASGNRGVAAVAHRLQYHHGYPQTNAQADILNPDENAQSGEEVLQRGRPVKNAPDTEPHGLQDWVVNQAAALQQARQKGQTPVAQPKKKPAGPYQPRMTDPVSGRKMTRGQPVPAANAAPPARVTDPNSGQPMQRGRPVPTAYSGGLNSQVGLGLQTAGRAIAGGFGSPNRGRKQIDADITGAKPAPGTRAFAGGMAAGAAAGAQPGPPSRPSAPSRSAALGQSGSMPSRARANTNTLQSVMDRMPNTPGYESFPVKKKPKGY